MPPQSSASVAQPAEETKEEQASQAEVEDPFTVWQGDDIQYCDDLVYVLKLSNTTESKYKYRIQFKHGMSDTPADLVWPSEGLIGSIDALKMGQVVALLPKAHAQPADSVLSEIQKLQVTLIAHEELKN